MIQLTKYFVRFIIYVTAQDYIFEHDIRNNKFNTHYADQTLIAKVVEERFYFHFQIWFNQN